jgi:hypothetical protein
MVTSDQTAHVGTLYKRPQPLVLPLVATHRLGVHRQRKRRVGVAHLGHHHGRRRHPRGMALVQTLRHRVRDWLWVALVALAAVIVLTLAWELGEYVGDRLFDTALIPSKRDSAEDILFGTVGGLVGIAFSRVLPLWRRGG